MATATLAWADAELLAASDAVEDALPEAPSVFTWVSVPPEVSVSDSLTVHIVIRNRRQSEAYLLEDIEISDRYLDGFEIGTIMPIPDEVDHSSGTLSLYYSKYIGAQESEDIYIDLLATKAGVFSGDIDLWSNDSDECATRRLQTEIVVEPEQ